VPTSSNASNACCSARISSLDSSEKRYADRAGKNGLDAAWVGRVCVWGGGEREEEAALSGGTRRESPTHQRYDSHDIEQERRSRVVKESATNRKVQDKTERTTNMWHL
jgi:hypothetical protein